MHYWVCGSRKGGGVFAQAECCPEGGGFVEGVGCVAMENCTESCDHSKIEDKIIGRSSGTLPLDDKITHYENLPMLHMENFFISKN